MRSPLCNCIAAVWWVLDSLRTMASRPFTASFNRKLKHYTLGDSILLLVAGVGDCGISSSRDGGLVESKSFV